MRLIEYLSNKKSNIALQNVIAKYGLAKFNFSISEYFIYDSKGVSQKALTNLETSYIDKYPFHGLYNFIKTTTSLTGCFFFFPYSDLFLDDKQDMKIRRKEKNETHRRS